MALRKLAGPFDIVDETGATPVMNSTLGGNAAWVPNLGLAISCSTANWAGIGMLALDGVVNRFAANYYPGAYVWGWDALNHVILARAGSGDELVLDARSFVGYKAAIALGIGKDYIKLPSRRLVTTSGGIIAVAEDGSSTTEFTGRAEFEFAPSITAGRADDAFFWGNNALHPSGFLQCCFYDATRMTASPSMYVPALSDGSNWWLRYAPELKIIVAVDLDNAQMSIWSLDTLPESLGDPVVTSGRVAKGNIAAVTAQLLGGNGEACAGELVDWSLESGDGELLDVQSKTDAAGYASARIFYPLTAAGDSTVVASVRC